LIQEAPSPLIIVHINDVFAAYLGFHDDDLALQVWELGRDCETLLEMISRIKKVR
jgi:hypothetical protein